MLTLFASVAAMILSGGAPTEPRPIQGVLLDNSCARSLEEARFAARPALWGGPDAAPLHKLTDLPDANEEILVNRTFRGCPVPVIVARDVSKVPAR